MVDSTPSQDNTNADKGHSGKKFQALQNQVDESVREEWEQIQNDLKKKLVEVYQFDWVLERGQPNSLQRVAAVDISYSKTD